MGMFTFGREHEKRHALRFVRDKEQAELISEVVDAVHDLIEGAAKPPYVAAVLKRAMIDGKSGVWEQTESWLRKLSVHYPAFPLAFEELAIHPDWRVRWRIACVLDLLPEELAQRIGRPMLADRSKKVRTYAEDRLASFDASE